MHFSKLFSYSYGKIASGNVFLAEIIKTDSLRSVPDLENWIKNLI